MKSSLYLLLLLIIANAFGDSGCANIVPPSGGLRDSLAPILLRAAPQDSTVNFKGNRITLDFDEYIDLQDVPANIVVSPTPQSNPVIEVRLRTITIKLKDSLESNTTYTIDFGNAIKDINEGNVLRNFDYSFSTGPALDSFQLSGNVVLAETGQADSTLIVMLYRNSSDSAVRKEKPRYVAKLNSSGSYIFRNLPAGTFYLYALGDQGGGRMYLNNTQFFAFTDTAIVINSSRTAPLLQAYKEATTAPTNASTAIRTPVSTDKRLRFTTNLNNNKQDLQKDLIITFEQSLRYLDTSRIQLRRDSTFTPVAYSLSTDSAKKKLTLTSPWKEAGSYHFITDKDFAEDSLGRKLLKTDTLSFVTSSRADYGKVRIRFKNIDTAANPVLQFVQNNSVFLSASIKSGTFFQELFPPGEYELRVLLDRNGNGVWDPGRFFGTKKQPEIVLPIERRITVKPASDNDLDLSL